MQPSSSNSGLQTSCVKQEKKVFSSHLQKLVRLWQECVQHFQQDRYTLAHRRELVDHDGSQVEEAGVRPRLVQRHNLLHERRKEGLELDPDAPDGEADAPAAALHNADVRLEKKLRMSI